MFHSALLIFLIFVKNINARFYPEFVKIQSNKESIVDYYLELIEFETEEAKDYVLPTSNVEHFLGYNPGNDKIDFGEFDFIIIGAGTAGSTLAYELTKNVTWKVLLLEAGDKETDFSLIPSFAGFLKNSKFNWGYYTSPQKNSCKARLNNRCTYPRGKALGGSSSINDMLCFRGNSFDYDSWFAAGNEGWSYEEVLPYFKKLETAHFEGDEKYRGKNGPIKVKYPKATIPSLENFIEANMALGRDVVDFNGAKQIGVGRNQFTIDNGQRESGGSVFIKRAGCRDTLKILQNALVTKVVLNEKKEAVGVEFVREGSVFIARANREVILSAGAVNTPQILMLSGIGPKEELEPVGIVPIVELQGVGRNLDDHVIFLGLSFTSNISALPSKPLRQEVKEYLSGYGPLTLPKTSYATTFLKVKTSPLPQDVPDIQLIFIPFTCKQQPEEPEKTCFNIYPILLHPKSKGTISLASDSPIHYPIINTNTLFEASDRQIVYEGIQAVLDLITTEPLQKINATYIKSSIPECDAFKLFSENYWMCNLEYLSAPSFHTTSTARMGSEEDSVVDNRLRVKGVKNLRIVDASVMPSVTSGPTNLPTFMIAARAADFIREDQITRV